jgi:hypothetical protein
MAAAPRPDHDRTGKLMLESWDELELHAGPDIVGDCRNYRRTKVSLRQLISEHQGVQFAAACPNHPLLIPEECGLFTPTATRDEAWQAARRLPNGVAYHRVGQVLLADEPPF